MDKTSNIFPFLQTERLVLAKVTEEHCTTQYLSWLHNPQVNRYLESGRTPEDLQSLKAFVANAHQKGGLFLAIHIKENNLYIGNIKIDQINRIHGTAEYGIMMGEAKEWGKGYAKEATIAILEHAFNKLNLRKITLGVIAENEAAVKLYEKLGFSLEGTLKKHLFCNGKYQDVYRMAIFQND